MKFNWKDEEKVREIVKNSISYSDCIRKTNLTVRSGNFHTLKKYIKRYNICIDHFTYKPRQHKGYKNLTPLCDILIKNSSYPQKNLKKRIIKNNLIKHKYCEQCGLSSFWNGKALTLQLDHINGVSNDHRLENLRFLCPNCHTQTKTYASKNIRTKKNINTCPECNAEIHKNSTMCVTCHNKERRRWSISKKALKELVWSFSLTEIGEFFNVSGNAIKKRCNILQIERPPMGYWNSHKKGDCIESIINKFPQ